VPTKELPGWSRRSPQGGLTDALIPTEQLSHLLAALLDRCAQATFVVERRRVDLRASKLQAPTLIFDDAKFRDGTLDERLERSLTVQVIVRTSDHGLARVDLTRRTWEVWIKTGEIHDILKELVDGMQQHRKFKPLTPGLFALLIVWPLLALFVAAFALTIAGAFDERFVVPEDGLPPPVDRVIELIALPVAIAWLVSLVLAIVLMLAWKVVGGSLRQLPSYVSLGGLLGVLARARENLYPMSKETARASFIAIVSSVSTAVIMLWLFGRAN